LQLSLPYFSLSLQFQFQGSTKAGNVNGGTLMVKHEFRSENLGTQEATKILQIPAGLLGRANYSSEAFFA
jgi:hypothetical protein